MAPHLGVSPCKVQAARKVLAGNRAARVVFKPDLSVFRRWRTTTINTKKTNMKTPTHKIFAICSALALASGLVASASAQALPAAPMDTTTANYGLLGTTYAGGEFGYSHHVEGPPSVLRRYGFMYNQPLPEGVDFNFNYDYLTGSALGLSAHAQTVSLGLTGYLPQSWGKPFLNGDVGWNFRKTGGMKDDSFTYKLKTGIEFQVLPPLVIVPYAYYQDAPHFSDHAWYYGAMAAYRFTRQWSGTLGAEIDEHHNLEYTAGVNYHY
jgi:hypothetical protein